MITDRDFTSEALLQLDNLDPTYLNPDHWTTDEERLKAAQNSLLFAIGMAIVGMVQSHQERA